MALVYCEFRKALLTCGSAIQLMLLFERYESGKERGKKHVVSSTNQSKYSKREIKVMADEVKWCSLRARTHHVRLCE